MRRAVLAPLAIVIALASPLSSQPVFRTGTTLVEVSAVVTSGGRPVTDLRADEITVLDNGVPQPLVAFEHVDLGQGDEPAQRRDFVLLIDDLHIHPSRSQPTIEAALAFIDALGAHDRLAVVRTGPPDAVMDLELDRDAARALVRAVRGQKLVSAPAPGELEMRTRATLSVIEQVAAALRSDAAERRAVLLISEGHPAFTQESSAFMDRDRQGILVDFLDVLREAALSNVAIYTVDPTGLRAPASGSSGTMPMHTSDLAGSLAALAVNTGGLQARWSNDLTYTFPRLLQDSRQYYRVAYVQPEPSPGKKQPRSRSIKVQVSREGVAVRARQRYAPAP